jgi:hypothetical protein
MAHRRTPRHHRPGPVRRPHRRHHARHHHLLLRHRTTRPAAAAPTGGRPAHRHLAAAYSVTALLLAGVAASTGARVVLLNATYTHRAERPDGGLWPEDTPQRVDNWNTLLTKVAAAHPKKPKNLDLKKVVCPGGTFTWNINGLKIRSDGLHFTPDSVKRIIAPWLLPQLKNSPPPLIDYRHAGTDR